jgi:hypothetical protein
LRVDEDRRVLAVCIDVGVGPKSSPNVEEWEWGVRGEGVVDPEAGEEAEGVSYAYDPEVGRRRIAEDVERLWRWVLTKVGLSIGDLVYAVESTEEGEEKGDEGSCCSWYSSGILVPVPNEETDEWEKCVPEPNADADEEVDVDVRVVEMEALERCRGSAGCASLVLGLYMLLAWV